MILGVDLDHAQGDHVAFLQHLFGVLDALLADLRDVNQAFEHVIQAGERAELGQAGNGALDQLADLVLLNVLGPGVALQLAQGEADALLLFVDADDLDLDFLPHLEHFGGVLDALPGNLGEVHQAVRAVDVDKSAEISQAGDAAGANFALGQLFDDALFDRLAGLVGGGPLGEDQAAALAVNFDHADIQLFADHLAPALLRGISGHGSPAREAHLRSRHEAAQSADRNDQSTFVVANDFAVDRFFGRHQLFGFFPAFLLQRARVGQDQIAVGILGVHNVDRDFHADFHLGQRFSGDSLVLSSGDDTLRLGANTNQNLPRSHAGDHAFSNLAPLGKVDSQAFCFQQRSHIVMILKLVVLGRCPLLELGVILFHTIQKLQGKDLVPIILGINQLGNPTLPAKNHPSTLRQYGKFGVEGWSQAGIWA